MHSAGQRTASNDLGKLHRQLKFYMEKCSHSLFFQLSGGKKHSLKSITRGHAMPSAGPGPGRGLGSCVGTGETKPGSRCPGNSPQVTVITRREGGESWREEV